MSSYLNFYLVPKKENKEPLHFLSYSRASDVYQNFYHEINPVYMGNGDIPNYQELTVDDVKRVRDSIDKDIEEAKKSLDQQCEAFNSIENPSIEFMNEHTDTYVSRLNYIEELKEAKEQVNSIYDWIAELEYSDFEKVLINID